MNIWDWLFPLKCVGCGKGGVGLCRECISKLVVVEQKCGMCGASAIDGYTHKRCAKKRGLDAVWRVYGYDKLMQRVVKAVKYRFQKDLLVLCVGEMGRSVVYDRVDVIVPVPLHRLRENWRGFNQARVLADILAEVWEVEVVDVVKRKRRTKPVAEMENANERKRELSGAFEVVDRDVVRGKRVVIVDDVFTSGATMREISGELKKAGASWVGGWALAG